MIHENYEIPGYKYIDHIAKGGMGSINLYREEGLKGNLRIIKSIRRDILASPLANKARDNTEDEYRSLKSLEDWHRVPNVMGKIIESNKNKHIVMQYIKGQTLEEITNRLDKNAKYMEPEIAAYIAKDILKGIKIIHSVPIVHLDLKPENVMLRRDIGDPETVILDLGIAKKKTYNELLKVTAGSGTLTYMSPEQFKIIEKSGKKETAIVDEKSDIFQFGAIYYKILTNQSPFNNEDTYQRRLTFKKLKELDLDFIKKIYNKKEQKERHDSLVRLTFVQKERKRLEQELSQKPSVTRDEIDKINKTIKDEEVAKKHFANIIIYQNIIDGFYMDPRDYNHKIPKEQVKIIDMCLKPDPKYRWTLKEIMTHLTDIVRESNIDEDDVKDYFNKISMFYPDAKIW